MLNYAKGKPVGNNQIPFFDSSPPQVALVTTVRETAATAGASSIININPDTTAIEVAAVGGPAFIKWLQQSVVDSSVAGTSVIVGTGVANFDNVIAQDTVKRFILPIAGIGAQEASVAGARDANGLFKNVAIIGKSSVLVTQYA